MRRLAGHSAAVVVTIGVIAGTSAFGAGAGAAVRPAGPGKITTKWTKISTDTSLAIASAGLFRTADGRLHVVWPRHDGANGFSLHYSTIGSGRKLVNTGTVVSKWSGISAYPRLVAGPGGGIRLIFTGGNGKNGSPFNTGAMYSATAGKAGTTWTLNTGSLSHSANVPLTDTAAVTEANGTPVAAWSGVSTLQFHVGIDPNSPAASGDSSISAGADGAVVGPTLARDKTGGIWAAWFNESGQSNQGYWVRRLVPGLSVNVKAPSSGGKNLANNQPFQAVALTARVGGGEYLAYCVPGKLIECTHVALWRVGAAKASTLPGSASGSAQHVAIAAGPAGHLWILWFDTSSNKIHVVRTNAAATKFATVKTISGPPNLSELFGLQAEGSKGTLDIVTLVLQNGAHSTPSYWDTQLKT